MLSSDCYTELTRFAASDSIFVVHIKIDLESGLGATIEPFNSDGLKQDQWDHERSILLQLNLRRS